MKNNDPLVDKKVSIQMPNPCAPRHDHGPSAARPRGDETLDTLFNGELAILQSRRGYRFSLDALLLAHFAAHKGTEKVADLGTGNGVIPMILSRRNPAVFVWGLEVQEALASRARRNLQLNGMDKRVQIVQGDVRTIHRMAVPESFDAVLCNPPYRRPSSGRASPNAEKKIARHEVMGTLQEFLTAGRYLLAFKGRMTLVYPAVRCTDLLHAMRDAGLEPKRLRMVHSFPDTEASLVLVEGIKGGKSGIKILSPLIVYQSGQKYSPEVQSMLDGSPME
jgi:tRNA1(Val) A37 N6-methylase TrmN6